MSYVSACVLVVALIGCGDSSDDDPGSPAGDVDTDTDGSGNGGDAGSDVDVTEPPDPCATANGGCDALVTCTNNAGVAVCGACPAGYSGSASCVDVDECATATVCSGEHEQCVNQPGSYACECVAGYARDDAGMCVNVDECDAPGACWSSIIYTTTCTDTDGSYTCSPCPSPLLGDSKVLCVNPPPRFSVFDEQPARSLSRCFTTGTSFPYSYGTGSTTPADLRIEDAAIGNAIASLTVTTEPDADTPLVVFITDIGYATCTGREPQGSERIDCQGPIFDINKLFSTLSFMSARTGSGTVRIRYCSPAVPTCSEVRLRVTIIESDGIEQVACDPPPSLDAASDDGVAIDDVTADTTPTFNVNSAPGTTVQWFRDGVQKGAAVVGPNGIATFTDDLAGDPLTTGTHGYSVQHAGTGAPSAAYFIRVTAQNPH